MQVAHRHQLATPEIQTAPNFVPIHILPGIGVQTVQIKMWLWLSVAVFWISLHISIHWPYPNIWEGGWGGQCNEYAYTTRMPKCSANIWGQQPFPHTLGSFVSKCWLIVPSQTLTEGFAKVLQTLAEHDGNPGDPILFVYPLYILHLNDSICITAMYMYVISA